jgi:hypothetical protein
MSIPLTPEFERHIAEQAAAGGYPSVEAYLRAFLPPVPSTAEGLSDAEFEQLLEDLAEDVPSLPTDFSRADLYLDHD